MFRPFISCFILAPTIAFAQAVPTDAQIAAEKTACEKKYNPDTVPASLKISVALAQEKCKLEIDVRVLELKAKAAGTKNDVIEKEIARQRVVLDAMQKSILALEAKKDSGASIPPLSAPVGMVGTAPVMPFATNLNPPPLGATWDAFGVKAMSAVVYNLTQGAIKWFALGGEQRVVVYRNGTPIPIAHRAGGAITFTEFYTDLNKDARPDPIPARGIDPSLTDQFYIAYEPGDEITLVYLVPVGMVAIPGIGTQMLWGNPRRIVYHDHEIEHANGRPKINGRLGSPKYE